MTTTRNDPEWPEAVRAAAEQKLQQGFVGDWPTQIVATWLDGRWLYIVYRREGGDVFYGLCRDTHVGLTGSDWPDAESIGYEIAAYGVLEPHGSAEPRLNGPPTKIYWMGEVHGAVPHDLTELRSDALWPEKT